MIWINDLRQIRRHEVHPAPTQVALYLDDLPGFRRIRDGAKGLGRVGANWRSGGRHVGDIGKKNKM